MRKTLLSSLLMLALFCPALYGQTQLTGPPTVKVGQPIKFQVQDPDGGDLISWQVLSPRGDDTTTIQTEFGIEYIVDTGCAYKGRVEVLCTVVNFDKQKFIQEVLDCTVEGKVIPPDPDKPDEPDKPNPPNPDWESKVPADVFNDIGIRIDTFIHNNAEEISRRAELASNFESLAQKMTDYEIRTPERAKEFLQNFTTNYRPEWDAVFNVIKEDGSKRSGMVWSQVIDYYLAIAAGIRGGG